MDWVLIADRSSFMREITAIMLKSIGWMNFQMASVGKETLEKYRRVHPLFVIMDLEDDGLEWAKALLEEDAEAVVLGMVQSGRKALAKQALKAGVGACLHKPFNQHELYLAIRTIDFQYNLAQKFLRS